MTSQSAQSTTITPGQLDQVILQLEELGRANADDVQKYERVNALLRAQQRTMDIYAKLNKYRQDETFELIKTRSKLERQVRESRADLKTAAKGNVSPSEPKHLWLVVLVLIGLVIAAYGIAQPLVLQELGFKDLSTSDGPTIISILVSVVALLVAGFGVAAYVTVLREVTKAVDHKVKSAVDDLSDFTYELLSATRINEAYLQWGVLEPLLNTRPTANTADEARCKDIIDTAIGFARSAHYNAMSMKNPDPARIAKAKWNLAFYLACKYSFDKRKAGAAAGEALSLLPPSAPADIPSEAEAAENFAWIRMCCSPRDSEDWDEARALATKLFEQSQADPGRAEAMRLRYQAAFGEDVFEAQRPTGDAE
jgi:hypothetical protein